MKKSLIHSVQSYELIAKAFLVRKMILEALYQAGGGHYGGALSVTDLLLVLYHRIMNFSIQNKNDLDRDRLILSKGHSVISLYCILAELGIIEKDTLGNYGKFNAKLEGHPDMTVTPGIDFSSGSLGQGLSVGLGMALAVRNKAHIWVVLGDGECQEGQIWEAALLASRYKVDNLHVVIDANGAQECGYKYDHTLTQEPIPRMADKWQAFGWAIDTVDGHDLAALEHAMQTLKHIKDQPSLIIAQTRKGAGVSMFENEPERFHCVTLTEDQHKIAIEELENYATIR